MKAARAYNDFGMSDSTIQNLKKILPADAVIYDPEELFVYECDGLPQHKVTPRAVVFPGSTEDVSNIVRVLSADGIPFTARGAGTGLSGGALALNDGIVIELARMRRLLKVDPETRTAVVETGIVNADLSRKAQPHGLYYAPDPSSQSACTIGGNIAENAGGSHCLKYGVTTDHVLALKVVLSSGEVVEFDTGRLQPGYDLAGVFVGSEGTFGIATEATLRLLPIPQAVRTILAEFLDVNDASRAVSAIIAAGLVPAALEMMDAATIRAVEASIYAAGLPVDAAAALIIELDGLEAGLDIEAERVEAICRQGGARTVRRAVDEQERQKIWRARKGAFGAMGRLSPDVMIQDAVVPRSKLPNVLAATYEIAWRHNLEVANVFHAGDGNLHPLLPFDARDTDQVSRIKEAGREIMDTCVRAGGTITGEHGVGLDKKDYLPLIFSDDDMEAMLRVRAAFDPVGLCNPGKIIPVRRGCGEARTVAESKRSNGDKPSNSLVQTGTESFTPLRPLSSIHPARHSEFDAEAAVSQIGRIIGNDNVRLNDFGSPVAAFPGSVEELSEVLRLSFKENWAVVPAGSGTWLEAGNSLSDTGVAISVSRMDKLIEYEPADLVATMQAGIKLSELNSSLFDQWLPLDPPDDGQATIGAVAATGAPGAQTVGYGAPRHHVVGMRVVLADGRVIKAGGRVVKNVAGYDLCKLFVGSYGTLGIITEVTCRLRPRPAAERTIIAQSDDIHLLIEAGKAILASELLPVAVEMVSPGNIDVLHELSNAKHALMVRFAGMKETVQYQTELAATLLTPRRLTGYVVTEDRHLWSWVAALSVNSTAPIVWRSTVPRNALGDMIAAIEKPGDGNKPLTLQAGLGDGRICVLENEAEDPEAICERLHSLRKTARSLGGCLVMESAPSSIKGKIDAWGEIGASVEIMRRLKNHLDGRGQFSSGRFVVGI